jgi:hypothetical protein
MKENKLFKLRKDDIIYYYKNGEILEQMNNFLERPFKLLLYSHFAIDVKINEVIKNLHSLEDIFDDYIKSCNIENE